jgi:hypothetical protein
MPHVSPFYVGIDLGQAADPSALVVLEHTTQMLPPAGTVRPTRETFLHCRWLQRWPLGTSYTAIAADVVDLVAGPPLAGCQIVLDASGCGRPVYDLFKDLLRKRRLTNGLHGVVITGGMAESFENGFHRVSKAILISGLQVFLGQRRLQFAAELPDVDVLIREMQNYRTRITASSNEVFAAREGEHDDLLLALAIGAWYAERHPPTPPAMPMVYPFNVYNPKELEKPGGGISTDGVSGGEIHWHRPIQFG